MRACNCSHITKCLLLPITRYVLFACYLCITCAPIYSNVFVYNIGSAKWSNFASAKEERSIGIGHCEVECDNEDIK